MKLKIWTHGGGVAMSQIIVTCSMKGDLQADLLLPEDSVLEELESDSRGEDSLGVDGV